MIEDAVLLLVGRVVLLVDDDQPKFPERQEKRRARAGHDAHAAFGDLPPDPLAHARRHVGMPFGGLGAEAVVEAFEEGLRQRDFRQQDEHLLAGIERRRDRLEIDLGLARAGDAVEQRHAEAAGGGGWRAAHRPLRAVRRSGSGCAKLGSGAATTGRGGIITGSNTPCSRKSVDDGQRNAGRMGEAGARPRQPVGGELQHARARRRHAIGPCRRQLQPLDERLGIEGRRAPSAACGRPCRAATAYRRRSSRRSGACRGRPAGSRRPRDIGLSLPRVDAAAVTVPDDPRHLARAERHAHDRPRPRPSCPAGCCRNRACRPASAPAPAPSGSRTNLLSSGVTLPALCSKWKPSDAIVRARMNSKETAMKFFVDTADVKDIRELNDLGLLDGVTTNPSLILKSGGKHRRGDQGNLRHRQGSGFGRGHGDRIQGHDARGRCAVEDRRQHLHQGTADA